MRTSVLFGSPLALAAGTVSQSCAEADRYGDTTVTPGIGAPLKPGSVSLFHCQSICFWADCILCSDAECYHRLHLHQSLQHQAGVCGCIVPSTSNNGLQLDLWVARRDKPT